MSGDIRNNYKEKKFRVKKKSIQAGMEYRYKEIMREYNKLHPQPKVIRLFGNCLLDK